MGGNRGYGKGASGRRLLSWYSLSALSAAAAYWGLRTWSGSPYALAKKVSGTAGFSYKEAVALIVGCYALPAATALLVVATGLAVTKKCTSYCLKVFVLSADSLLVVGVSAVGGYYAREVLACGVLFCGLEHSSDLGGWQPHYGLTLLLPFSLLFFAFLDAVVRTLCNPEAQEWDADEKDCWASDCEESSDETSSISTSSSGAGSAAGLRSRNGPRRQFRTFSRRHECCRKLFGIILAVLVLPALFLLTTVLPNSFRDFTPKKMAAWMAADVTGKAEVPGAYFQTYCIRVSKSVVLKLFPDTLMFYVFLELVALGALFCSFFQCARRRLGRELLFGVTIGQAILLLALAVVLVCWSIYWLHDHSYHSGTEMLNTTTEKFARWMGLTASLFMGFALLPASKNSMWLVALGLSCESVVLWHRILGMASVICIVLHGGAFMFRYYELGTLSTDLIFPAKYQKGPSHTDYYDNFTIFVATWVGLPTMVIMGVIAPFMRERRYELFKYTHYIFLVLVPVVFFHGQSSWFFLLGGTAFWLVDAAIRITSSMSVRTRVLSAQAHDLGGDGKAVELRLSSPPRLCGQFVWLNVPGVSTMEWHPFSVASGPQDARMQLIIRSMGEGSWTQRLYNLVEERGRDIAVQLDGPYGVPPDCRSRAAVLFIAGGVGITGVLSSFRALALATSLTSKGRPHSMKGLRHVRLIWCVRSPAMLKLCAGPIIDCLDGMHGDGSDGSTRFSAQVYVTRAAAGEEHPLRADFGHRESLGLFEGRPDWQKECTEIMELTGKQGTVLVQACGPEPMVEAAGAAVEDYNSRARDDPFFFEAKSFRF